MNFSLQPDMNCQRTDQRGPLFCNFRGRYHHNADAHGVLLQSVGLSADSIQPFFAQLRAVCLTRQIERLLRAATQTAMINNGRITDVIVEFAWGHTEPDQYDIKRHKR